MKPDFNSKLNTTTGVLDKANSIVEIEWWKLNYQSAGASSVLTGVTDGRIKQLIMVSLDNGFPWNDQ
jgi:hypothetical protein